MGLPSPKSVLVKSLQTIESVNEKLMEPFDAMLSTLGLPTPPKPVKLSEIVEQMPEPPKPEALANLSPLNLFQHFPPPPSGGGGKKYVPPRPLPKPEAIVVSPNINIETPAKKVRVRGGILI